MKRFFASSLVLVALTTASAALAEPVVIARVDTSSPSVTIYVPERLTSEASAWIEALSETRPDAKVLAKFDVSKIVDGVAKDQTPERAYRVSAKEWEAAKARASFSYGSRATVLALSDVRRFAAIDAMPAELKKGKRAIAIADPSSTVITVVLVPRP